MLIVIFLIGIAAGTASPLSSPHLPPRFLTGIAPPIIGRPLPSQPRRIPQGCFYPARARNGPRQFFKNRTANRNLAGYLESSLGLR